MRFLGIVKSLVEIGDYKCIVVYFFLLYVFFSYGWVVCYRRGKSKYWGYLGL